MTKSVILTALQDFEKAWKQVHPITTSYVRSEVNPQFAAIVPPTDVVLVILFDIEMEGVSGSITVCLPYAAIEPILPKLKAQFQSEQMEIDQVWVRQLREELMQTEVELIVDLGATKITPRELLKMKVGSTLVLRNDVSDPLQMRIEGVPKFKVFPGVSRGNKAVQVTQILERQK